MVFFLSLWGMMRDECGKSTKKVGDSGKAASPGRRLHRMGKRRGSAMELDDWKRKLASDGALRAAAGSPEAKALSGRLDAAAAEEALRRGDTETLKRLYNNGQPASGEEPSASPETAPLKDEVTQAVQETAESGRETAAAAEQTILSATEAARRRRNK